MTIPTKYWTYECLIKDSIYNQRVDCELSEDSLKIINETFICSDNKMWHTNLIIALDQIDTIISMLRCVKRFIKEDNKKNERQKRKRI